MLKSYIKKNSTVIIGVSGGPDSIFLLNKILELKKNYPFKIVVAHVNHKLRKKDSDLDQKFVQNLAKKQDLIFELIELKKIPAGNLEEQCRKARYVFFESLRQKYKADWIITAHQQDDQIETVIFNLIRGSFLDGLKGIQEADQKRHILRPLLNISKTEIISWLKSRKIKYRIDKTNRALHFSRNLIRHKVVPVFKKINSGFEKTFIKNLENLKSASVFINSYSETWLKTKMYSKSKNSLVSKNSENSEPKIPLNEFLSLEPIIQKTVIATLYKKLNGTSNNFNQQHLEQILQILAQKRANRKKEFGIYFIAVTKKNGQRIIKFLKKN